MSGTTFTWTGAVSNIGTLAANWAPSGGPPGSGGTEIANFGTLDFTDHQFSANRLKLNGGTLQVFNDTTVPATSSFNASTTLIGDATGTAALDIFGSFVNQGTILADGPSGSTFTIDVQETTSGTATLPGIFYNPGTILVDAGNTLTINVGADSEMFNTSYIVADGGTVKITASPSAIVGGDGPVRGFEVIEDRGTLETASAYPASNGDNGTHTEYAFGDSTPGNTLKIDNIGSFGGAIIQFGAGDTIDLGTLLAVGTLAYTTTTGLLSLEAANGTTLASLLVTNFGTGLASGSFAVTGGTADGINIGVGADGDTVLTTSVAPLESSGTSGTWQSDGSWLGGVVPGTTASPVIGLGASAPFTLTTGSTPVSVGGFAISSPLATVQITSDTTLTTGSASDYAGTLDITTGNTLTAGALQLYSSGTELTIATGATADLAGRINLNTEPVDGVWTEQTGGNPYAFTVSAGTAVINGALLAGPPTSAGGGGDVTIGYDSAGQPAVVIVNAGGTVTDTKTNLGSDPTSSGSLTLNGAGASWTDMLDFGDTYNTYGYILVGYNDISSSTPAGLTAPGPVAAAQLLIENGATLTDQRAGYIGDSIDSAGNATVTTGGLWNLASNGVGFLEVGDGGSGTLSVLNGGSVALGALGTFLSNGSIITGGGMGVGQSAGANGTVIVSGAGSQISTLDGISVGKGGQGLLDILNGGTVLVNANGIGVGQTADAGSSGTVMVGGSGAAAALDFAAAASGMSVGAASRGMLIVSDNGSINMFGTGGIGIGVTAGASGTVLVSGTASVITLGTTTKGIGVGQSGQGLLEIENGGTVSVSSPLNNIGIGENGGSSGTVIVSGAGALLALAAGNPGISVGTSGQGLLEVLSDGTVAALAPSNGIDAGDNSGSSGTIIVSGAGALIAIDAGNGAMHIGISGQGLVEVQGGGSIDIAANNLDLGGAGSTTGGPAPLGGAGAVAVTTGGKIDVGENLYVFAGSTVSVDGTSGIDVGTSDSFIAGAINLENGHSILGNGLIAAPVVNNGLIEASNATAPNSFTPGTLEVQGRITGSGVLQTGNGILRLDMAPPSGETIQFGTGSELILAAPGTALANPVTGLSDGDRIDLNLGAGVNITNASVTSPGTVTVFTNTGSYLLTNVGFAAGSGTSFFWGTDPSNGFDDIQVATPVVNWTGAAGDTLYSDAGNWQDDAVPNDTDTVNFVNNPGTVTSTGNALELNIGPFNQVNSGTWFFNGAGLTVAGSPNAPYPPSAAGFYANTVLNGGTLNASGGEANIGNVDGVTVTAQGGAQVVTMADNIGTNNGQSGSLVLTGNGTTWIEQVGPAINGYGVGYLTLGGYGGPSNGQTGSAGYLTVTDNATLSTGGSGTVGGGSGSFGSATVSAGGVWTAAGLQVGSGGTGTLAVSDGVVNISGYVGIGQNTGAEGAVSVTNSGIFNAGTALTVGYQGGGTLAVGAGTVTTTGQLSLGGGGGGSGIVSLTNGTITAANGVSIGGSGAGTMTINSGGTVLAGGTFSGVGINAGSDGNLIVNAGGVWDETIPQQGVSYVFNIGVNGASGTLATATGNVLVTGAGALLNMSGNPLSIGQGGGSGTLTVANGGTVLTGSANSNLDDASLALGHLGSASVVVEGAGSELVADGFMYAGRAGTAAIEIENNSSMLVGVDPVGTGGMQVGAGSSGTAGFEGGNGELTVTTHGVLTDDQYITIGGNGVNGEANVNNGGTIEVGTSLVVGTATNLSGTIYGGSGALSIGAGGTVELTEAPQTAGFGVIIGNENGGLNGVPTDLATGEVTVSGLGALLNANGNAIAVGEYSNGVLTVGQGATVEAGTQDSTVRDALSDGRQGDGSVIVDGGDLLLGGGAYVGRAGTGNMLVENDGSVNVGLDGAGSVSNSALIIGGASSSNGTLAYVGGTGSMQVVSDGTVTTQTYVEVGDNGTTGNLSINSGGLLETTQRIFVGNSATIAAGGSLISASGTTVVASPTLEAGDGSVDIGSRGTLASGQGFDVGAGSGASGSVTVGGDASLLVNTGTFIVGDIGLGNLLIENGGSVISSPGTVVGAPAAVVANQSGAAGSSVNVTGAGSDWQVGGALVVGNGATGALDITNGGGVSAATLDAGVGAGGAGVVTVSGPDADLVTTGTVSVGDAGSGELSILDGANVTIGGDLNIANSGTGTGNVDIEDTTGTITFGGNTWVGYNGVGVLTIGFGVTYIQDEGGINAGPNSTVTEDSFADPSPDVNNSSPNPFALNAQGVDQLAAYMFNSGEFTIPNSHTLTIETPIISGGGSFSLGTGDSLVLNADTVSGQTFILGGDDRLTIGIDKLGTIDLPASGTGPFTAEGNPNLGRLLVGGFDGVIAGFTSGDTIDVDTSLSSAAAGTLSVNGAVVSVVEIANGATLGVVRFDTAANAAAAVADDAIVLVPCFAAGTRISTAHGEVAVEAIGVGERVRVLLGGGADGFAEVVWVGRREVDCVGHATPRKVWPVRVDAGAFGPGRPYAALWLSPDHAVFVEGVLIPVRCLVNGSTIVQVPVERVVYHHVELAEHDVLLAEGLPAESFLDMRDGTNYANRSGPVRLYPDFSARMWEAFGCARLVVTGAELVAARALVAGFAAEQEAA